MDYKIIAVYEKYCSCSARELEEEVNKLLNQGWKLQGGVSVSSYMVGHSCFIAMTQAMVKE